MWKPTFPISNLANSNSIHYHSDILKSLRPRSTSQCMNTFHSVIPPEIRRRKRGRKGGVRARLRRRAFKPSLPTIITGNARSLNNKLDELCSNAKYMFEYRESSIICFSETWFTSDCTNAYADVPNFNIFRADRNDNSGKQGGGGVCAYINERWCHKNNITGIQTQCTPDLEILTLNLRPFYLPREFSKIILNVIYIPPHANSKIAINELTNIIQDQQGKSIDAAIFITGDFNNRSLAPTLPNFHQYVNVPTRDESTIDLCYCNVPNAYKCTSLPPLGSSDHNMTLLSTRYRTVLKRVKPRVKTVNTWNDDDVDRLRGCLDCTDWNVFIDSCCDIDELCDTVTDYIKFCENVCAIKKNIKIFPNSKPWINSNIINLLKQKKEAFKNKDKLKMKTLNKDIKSEIWSSKVKYKRKIENLFRSNNSRETWVGLKSIVGYKEKQNSICVRDEKSYANDLNSFYARFENNLSDKMTQYDAIRPNDPLVVIDEDEIRRVFECVNVRKACGPDGIKGRIVKMCSSQLSYIYTYIINMSLLYQTVPSIWKCSEIIPVPKRDKVYELNDLRPVALTSIIMKCMEKTILRRLRPFLNPSQDPMQFAYQEKKSVEDAIVVFLDHVYKHLDKPKSYCRILFVDFSSAFNTIQPSMLLNKMNMLGVNSYLTAWIGDFLSNRTQYVRINNTISTSTITNTGAPQGCVLSPVLFTLYTNECRIDNAHAKLIKFADDSTIIGLIKNDNDESHYRKSVEWFTNWCEQNKLLLNVKKTKELIIDFRLKKLPLQSLTINNEEVDQVSNYKYLGITIDDKLDWQIHSSLVYKKVNKRMFFLRKLKSFNIDKTLLSLFYHAAIESIITFCIIGWGGNARRQDSDKINRIIKRASKICHFEFQMFSDIYSILCSKKINSIQSNVNHPLAPQIILSERSKRPIFIKCNRERYKKSFLPSSIKILQSKSTN